MRLSLVVCQESRLVQHAFYGSLAECFALGQKDSFRRKSEHGKHRVPDSCPLPVAMFIWEQGLSSLGGACFCQDVWRALV